MRARARQASIRAWLARGPGPQAIAVASFVVGIVGPRRADEVEDRLDHRFADRHAPDEKLDGAHAGCVEHLLGVRFAGAGGLEEHATLGIAIRVEDVDLQQETVELGLGEGIGAFLLERVLRREHMKRRRQIMADAGHGDVMLLHGLQKRRLGARAGAVDLVGHQELGEYRPLHETEGARAVGSRCP